MKGELNDRHKNNSPNGSVEGKFIGRHRDNLLDRKAVSENARHENNWRY